jgi:hypothetical protein
LFGSPRTIPHPSPVSLFCGNFIKLKIASTEPCNKKISPSRSCSSGRLSGGNPSRLKYYYLVAYLLPIIIPVFFATFCYFYKDLVFLLDTWVIVAKQRSIPGLHFALRTEDFMRTFGLFEIVIKLVTLGFFLGSIFYIWKSVQELRSIDLQVHRPRVSNWNKYWSTSHWIQSW